MRPLSLSKEEFSEYYLDLHKSILLVDDFISRYNQDQPLRKQFRASHRALMHELLRIYRIVLWKEQSGGGLLIPDTPLPYLSTNNLQLAKKIKCSGRTIQNLRQRLQEGGLIMDEVWHGSKANYELRLNPEVIFLGRRGDRQNWISLFEGEQPKIYQDLPDFVDYPDGLPGFIKDGTDLNAQAVPPGITRASMRPDGYGHSSRENQMERRTPNGNGLWKTTAEPVETMAKWPTEGDAVQSTYEEKNTVFTENFSPNCTLSLQDTNKLNQLEVDPCGKGAGTDENRSGNQRRNFLTGYETDSDEHKKPPRVARRPPVGEREMGKPPLSCRHFPLGGKTKPEAMEEMKEELRPEMFGEVVKSPLSCELFVPPAQANANPLGGKTKPEAMEEMKEESLPGTFGAVVAELPEKLGRRIFREVSKVWEVAREELYAGEWIAETERERAKARLAEYYIYAQPERYVAGTTEICERIRLVRKWIDRGRKTFPTLERWVPIPSVYFDYRNHRGFGRTKAWYKKHIEKRQEIGDKIAVGQAVARFRKILETSTGTDGPMEVYRQLKEKLRERGEGVMLQFQNAVIHE